MERLKHQQVYEDLLRKITDGEYGLGQKIPSQRQLMSEYAVSYSTITTALSALQHDGLIIGRHGQGTFVRATERRGQTSAPIFTAPHQQRPELRYCFGIFVSGSESSRPGFLQSLYEECQELNIQLQFIHFSGEEERRSRARDVLNGHIQVDACLIPHLPGYDDVVALFNASSFPYMIMDAPCKHEHAHCMLIDNERATHEAVEHLIKHGRERIACLVTALHNDDEENYWSVSRWRGYLSAIEQSGASHDSRLIYELEVGDEAEIERALDQFIAHDFDGLFVSTAGPAMKSMDILKEKGLRVPQDIALVACDVCSFDAMSHKEYNISGMDLSVAEATRMAVRALKNMLSQAATTITTVVEEVPVPFIRRTSCGCVA